MDKYRSVREWFATTVKELMEELDYRPYHLASLCKMSEQDVRQCLDGLYLPGLFKLVLLADRLECSVNYLLGYDEVEDGHVYERYAASDMFFTDSQYATCLSDRIRRYLEKQEINISDLADKTRFSESTLRRWFAKSYPCLPSTEKFLHICEVLNCTPSDLLGY